MSVSILHIIQNFRVLAMILAQFQPVAFRLSATFAIVDIPNHYWLSCRLSYLCKCNETFDLHQALYIEIGPRMKGEGGFARKARDEVSMGNCKIQDAKFMWNNVGRKRQVLLRCIILASNRDRSILESSPHCKQVCQQMLVVLWSCIPTRRYRNR